MIEKRTVNTWIFQYKDYWLESMVSIWTKVTNLLTASFSIKHLMVLKSKPVETMDGLPIKFLKRRITFAMNFDLCWLVSYLAKP